MRLIHLEDKVSPDASNKLLRVLETLDLDLDEIEGMFKHELLATTGKENDSHLLLFKSGRQMGVSKSFYEQINASWMKSSKLQA